MQLGDFVGIINEPSIPVRVIAKHGVPECGIQRNTVLYEGPIDEIFMDNFDYGECFFDELYVDTVDVGADIDVDGLTIYVC
jgi:hypothetical protein